MNGSPTASTGFARFATGARAVAERLAPSLERFGAGERRTLLLYAGYTVVLFVVCFFAVFPHDLALQRVLQQVTAGTSIAVETERASLGWTLRYAIAALRVRLRDDVADPLLNVEQLELAPSLLGLVRGSPYPLWIGASLYGGTIRGTVDPRPASFRVDAAVTDVDLARWTGARSVLEGTLRGRLQGRIMLDGDGRGPAAAGGDVDVRLPGLALEGGKIRGITVPDLHFGDVHLTGIVKNGRLEVGELVADGEELAIRGEGNVLLRTPLEGSVLALDLVITPAAAASDGLRMAVNLLPGSQGENGSKRIGIGGTLGRPAVR